MAGALCGDSWIPFNWLDRLENGAGGRDEVAALAKQLATLRCSAVGLAPEQEQQQQ
jgi:hypothetical protein